MAKKRDQQELRWLRRQLKEATRRKQETMRALTLIQYRGGWYDDRRTTR